MSLSLVEESYVDPILALARDPDLNREKAKTSKILLIIQGFPLVERKVSRLCLLSMTILQTLEKIELNLKNWTFMSLDINSGSHFDVSNSNEIRTFNNNVSVRVIQSCQELTTKLNKISADLDFITSASRTLLPIEFISDSGTLLTSLTLRNVKLKDELRSKVTVAYSKAKLITIGTSLEDLLVNGTEEQKSTIASYKTFVVSLLNQLNLAVEAEDASERDECLAVISDVEQMFEAFKQELEPQTPELGPEEDDVDDTFSSQSLYFQPTVHLIIKHPESTLGSLTTRRDLISSTSSINILQKSTISEELPYLMGAFNLARTIEEDVTHFSEKKEPEKHEVPKEAEVENSSEAKHFPHVKSHLPNTSLYSESQFVKPSASSYLYANQSLLSRLGIRPQIVEVPSQHLRTSQTINKPRQLTDLENVKKESHNLLTKENLETHVLQALTHRDNELITGVE